MLDLKDAKEPVIDAVKALVDAVKMWRSAVCRAPRGSRRMGYLDSQECDGENHQMECPCEMAREDLIAADNKLDEVLTMHVARATAVALSKT